MYLFLQFVDVSKHYNTHESQLQWRKGQSEVSKFRKLYYCSRMNHAKTPLLNLNAALQDELWAKISFSLIYNVCMSLFPHARLRVNNCTISFQIYQMHFDVSEPLADQNTECLSTLTS